MNPFYCQAIDGKRQNNTAAGLAEDTTHVGGAHGKYPCK